MQTTEPGECGLVIVSQGERAPMRPRKSRRDGGKGLVLQRRLGESIVRSELVQRPAATTDTAA
jgi:hypothetical protein